MAATLESLRVDSDALVLLTGLALGLLAAAHPEIDVPSRIRDIAAGLEGRQPEVAAELRKFANAMSLALQPQGQP